MASRSIGNMCTALSQLSLRCKVPQTRALLCGTSVFSAPVPSAVTRAAPFSCSAPLQRSGSPTSQHRHNQTAAALPDYSLVPTGQTEDLVSRVNARLASADRGRLFAVVHVGGRQRKVTTEDILVVSGLDPPSVGDRLRLEKVLLVGGADFTLLGRPILRRDQVRVEATVIEKTLSHYHIYCNYVPRMRKSRRLKLFRQKQTMLVINSIEVAPLSS